MQKKAIIPILLLIATALSCGGNKKTGTLTFTASGEDFARHGLTSRDGWDITFSKIQVCIKNPMAYNPDKSVEPVILRGSHSVDLATDGTAGKLKSIPAGNYQSLKFSLRRHTDGPFRDASILLKGTASKSGKKVPFTISFSEELVCDGKEGYVGEEVKGLLAAGKNSEVEMTFHIDHIFGDKSAPKTSHVNREAVGFNFFYSLSGKKKEVNLKQGDMTSHPDYKKLIKGLYNLPHLGEGHCDCKPAPQ